MSSLPIVGEAVFNTGMVGYTEAMTDPSYAGQILCFTYPLIGNYGVPDYMKDSEGIFENFESGKIQPRAIVASQVSKTPSHFNMKRTLDEWMRQESIPGLEGIDTRELTIYLREKGVMLAAIASDKEAAMSALSKASSYDSINFCELVSTRSIEIFGKNVSGRVIVVDCGLKLNIARHLVNRGYETIVVPYGTSFDEIQEMKPNGLVISNGPGDPKNCQPVVEVSRVAIDNGLPLLGICLGTQIVALSQGADTFKLKYGHRGQNKPCIDLRTGRCLVTSQNHGYTVAEDSLKGTKLTPWFVNADDHTIEGVFHETKPCISVQFHPEASPGPVDASYVFDAFHDKVRAFSK